jgi:hypothetical protein
MPSLSENWNVMEERRKLSRFARPPSSLSVGKREPNQLALVLACHICQTVRLEGPSSNG